MAKPLLFGCGSWRPWLSWWTNHRPTNSRPTKWHFTERRLTKQPPTPKLLFNFHKVQPELCTAAWT